MQFYTFKHLSFFLLIAFQTEQVLALPAVRLDQVLADQSTFISAAKEQPISALEIRQALKGKAVLVYFWTFGCYNCVNTYPWLRDLVQRFSSKDFAILGIHTPEFEHERSIQNVLDAMHKSKLTFVSAIDNDHRIWNAFENHAWPAVYLIDHNGSILKAAVGEIHIGDTRARSFESKISELISIKTNKETHE